MRTRSLLSLLMLTAGFAVVLVAPSRAQHVGTPSCEDCGVRANTTAQSVATDVHRSDASRVPLGTPEHRNEKRENHRATTSPLVKAQRPTHQRSKSANRNSPATPGMGQLLRMSSGTRTDLTLLDERAIRRPNETGSSRGPPADDDSYRLAQAASPRVHHLQAPEPAPEPRLPRSEPTRNDRTDAPPLSAHGRTARPGPIDPARPMAPHCGSSRDARAEGAASHQSPHPSGGVTA